MEASGKVQVGEKYKTVEPFGIIMPDGSSTHVAYESDTTELLGERSRGKEDVMQKMKDHAIETSKGWDEKLKKANLVDGTKIRNDEDFNLRVGNERAKPAAQAIDSQLHYATRNDVLEPGLDIHSTVRYTYDGPYVNTEGPTGVEKGGYKGSDYSIGSESSYQPAEYKSVYDS